jgi:hypothetical protein
MAGLGAGGDRRLDGLSLAISRAPCEQRRGTLGLALGGEYGLVMAR